MATQSSVPVDERSTSGREPGCIPHGFGLPTVLQRYGAEQLHVVFGPARHDGIGIHIATIYYMHAGQTVLGRQRRMNRFSHAPVRRSGSSRFGMHNQVRSIVIAGLGQMRLVANPAMVALDA